MFTHILVPLDGSKLAEMALSPAVNISRAMKAKLTLLRVVPQFAILAADPTLYEEMNRMGEEESLSYLRSIADGIELPAQIEVAGESGQPADVIIHYAETMGVDLILMSSHGRSGLSRWVFGSVAEHVMRKAPCSTAIVNARADQALRDLSKILIPLDGSELAELALQPGSSLALAMGADLHLMRAIPSAHQVLETGSMKSVFDDMQHKELEEAEVYLQAKVAEISNSHPHIVVELEKGSPADNIIDYAKDHEIGMIVMSSHGRSGFKRLIYGSVAEKVLRGACCTTMIIRGQ